MDAKLRVQLQMNVETLLGLLTYSQMTQTEFEPISQWLLSTKSCHLYFDAKIQFMKSQLRSLNMMATLRQMIEGVLFEFYVKRYILLEEVTEDYPKLATLMPA